MFRKAAFWCVAVVCGMLLDHLAFPIIPGSYFSLGMSAVLVISAIDADCRYEAALPGDFSPGQDVRHWRPGIMVRMPVKSPHPTDQWRASEYYGETALNGMRIRFVIAFEPTFLRIARFYGSALALCLVFLYSAYGVVSLMTRALSRRTGTLMASARRLPARIEDGEYPSWPSLDIQEMLEISDDGSGFDLHADGEGLPRSFGIIGMRERCRALGGEFRISSTRGAGTVVRASLPLDGRSRNARSDS